MRKRASIAGIAAVLVLAVILIVSVATSATATQGQPVIAGQGNSETTSTAFCIGTCAVTNAAVLGLVDDVQGIGLFGRNFGNGVGVRGEAGDGGTGVFGVVSGETGIGVNGEVDGTGSGVYGNATGTGAGVFGDTESGTGVVARSTGSGIALRVTGRAQYSRSGTATVTGSTTTPKSSVVVNNVALTSKSLVLVTPQKNVASVWVQAAVPAPGGSRITIFLNKTVTVSYPVAWFIVEKP
jgi:hypothetical protein